MSARWVALVLIATGLSCPPAHAKKPKPTPCPDGRFLTEPGTPLIDAGAAAEVLIVQNGAIAIETRCMLGAARITTTRKGTRISGHTAACGTLRKVKLKARFDAACDRLSGTLRAKKVRRPFAALRSRCGDGRVDAGGGEQCDQPGTPPCDAACALPLGTTTTTLPGPLDVWQAATVPYDPSCAACQRLASIERLPHLGFDLVFDVNPAIDDAPAQWGDCLASVVRCAEGGGTLEACVADARCPADCKTLFAGLVSGADVNAALEAFSDVFLERNAPCRPVAEAQP